jgi:hypothetical protein
MKFHAIYRYKISRFQQRSQYGVTLDFYDQLLLTLRSPRLSSMSITGCPNPVLACFRERHMR